MMKFFRKYNKHLLAVFMVLLMIVFLGGSALYELATPSLDRTVATSRLGDITLLDQNAADATTQLLQKLGHDWSRPWPGVFDPISPIEWILLNREAEEFGLSTDLAAVRSSIGPDADLEELSRTLGIRLDRILYAYAQYTSVQQMASMMAGAGSLSEAEVLGAAERVLKKAKVNAIVLPAEAFADEGAQFTEEEIQAQFAAYQKAEAGRGLAFGYYVPTALKLQYIKIDRDKLAEVVRVASLERKAKNYYDARPEQPAFRRPDETVDPETDEGIEGPSLVKSPYLSWEEARDIATDIVRRDEAAQVAERLANWFVQNTQEPWFEASYGEDGYKTPPEHVRPLEHYDEFVASLPPTISYPEAISTGVTDFVTREEVDDLTGLGAAWHQGRGSSGSRFRSLKELAFKTKAVIDNVPEEDRSNLRDYVAMFQTSRYPLTDADGNIYVFRVVDARPGHIPETVDEVRDRVLAGLRLKLGFENALWRAESLRSCEDAADLKEAFEKDEELVAMAGTTEGAGLGYFVSIPFALASQNDGAAGRTPENVYVGSGIGLVPFEVAELCHRLGTAFEKVEVVKLEDRAVVLVIEWAQSLPAMGEDFLEMRERFAQRIAWERSRALVADWLDPEQIRARTSFAFVTN